MAPPYVINTLNASITSTDVLSGAIIVDRSTGNPAIPSTVGVYVQTALLTVTTLILSNPVNATTYQFYFKNTDPSNVITVTWIEVGQSIARVVALYPGDLIILWQNPSGINAGITAIGATAITNGVLCEYFLGA
jgi:hypothetical protein